LSTFSSVPNLFLSPASIHENLQLQSKNYFNMVPVMLYPFKMSRFPSRKPKANYVVLRYLLTPGLGGQVWKEDVVSSWGAGEQFPEDRK
jgi:hypothetical protein